MRKAGISRTELQQEYKLYAKEQAALFPISSLEKPPGGCGFRLVTYNVHMECEYSDRRLGILDEGDVQMTRVLSQLEPDIVCMQEVGPRPLRFCAGGSAGGLPHVHYQTCFGRYGNAICSRHPMKDLLQAYYKRNFTERRGVIGATVCMSDGVEIRVYTTHLDVFDESERTRYYQVVELHAIIQDDLANLAFTGPVVLTGDFNAMHRNANWDHNAESVEHWEWIVQHDLTRKLDVKTSAMDYLLNSSSKTTTTGQNEEAKWLDTFQLADVGIPLVTAWSMRRVDYILHKPTHPFPPQWKCDPKVVFDVASDHLPLMLDVTFEAANL